MGLLSFILTLMAGVKFSRSTVCLPGSAFADLPLLSRQRRSSVPSRKWTLQFPPRSLNNMFAHRLFWVGLFTSLDSSTSTDYPNSHKLILVIADGMARSVRNTLTTLFVHDGFVIAPQGVQPHSDVAIAVVIIYTKFCDYDDATDNKSSLCLSLNVATLSMPMTQNKTIVTSAIAKLCWGHSCRRWCPMRSTKFFNWIWRVTDVCPDRYKFYAYMWMLIPRFSRFLIEDCQLYGA